MYGKVKEHLASALENLKQAGLYKEERIIESPQQAAIQVKGKEVLNFCANNYLGLANNPRLIEGAKKMMDRRGFGMSSVRFICGTQDIHKELEAAISEYFQTEDTILYAACFDANGGLFGSFLSEEDAIISDALNHASIIDGVCVRQSATAMLMQTWRNWRSACRMPRLSASVSFAPMVCSLWTAMWHLLIKSVTWQRNMMLLSWLTSLTLQVLWVQRVMV